MPAEDAGSIRKLQQGPGAMENGAGERGRRRGSCRSDRCSESQGQSQITSQLGLACVRMFTWQYAVPLQESKRALHGMYCASEAKVVLRPRARPKPSPKPRPRPADPRQARKRRPKQRPKQRPRPRPVAGRRPRPRGDRVALFFPVCFPFILVVFFSVSCAQLGSKQASKQARAQEPSMKQFSKSDMQV